MKTSTNNIPMRRPNAYHSADTDEEFFHPAVVIVSLGILYGVIIALMVLAI